jgi:hypothetical protein
VSTDPPAVEVLAVDVTGPGRMLPGIWVNDQPWAVRVKFAIPALKREAAAIFPLGSEAEALAFADDDGMIITCANAAAAYLVEDHGG